MKGFIVTIAITVLFFGFLHSQTPFFTEDWESGTEGWTILNTTTPNEWVRGTAAATGTGSYGMYVSDDGGITNNYYYQNSGGLGAANTTVHFYRDIAIPAEHVSITLSFDIRCRGESNYDFMRVYSMPEGFELTASASSFNLNAIGNDPNELYRIGLDRYNLNTLTNPVGDWQNVSIVLPTSQSGSTRRIVFTWVNDVSTQGQPPAAIDNIILTSMLATTPPLPASIVSPANTAINVSRSAPLQWEFNTTGAPATGYTLFLDTANPPITSYTLGNVTSYTPENMLTNLTTYYWQVVPFNSFGPATDCPVWSFTTIEPNKVLVGTGTDLLRDFPINMHFGYSLTQSIYYQWELADIPAGSIISGLTYHYTSSNVNLNEVVDVYIGNTTQTSFATTTSWVPFSELTHVYSGAITATQGDSYANIVFNADNFIYEGGHIVVAFHENVAGYTNHQNSNWYHTFYPDLYRSLYYRNDNTAANITTPPTGTRATHIANTFFSFAEISGGYITVTPATINLGTLHPEDTTEQTITLRNITNIPISVTDITMSAGISTTQPTTFELAAQQILQIPFTITIPTTAETFAGTITFTHEAQNGPQHIVELIARIIPNNMTEILGSGTTDTGIPFYPYYRYSYSQSIYLASEINRPSGDVLTEFRWHFNADANYTQEISVFMGYTSLTAFSGYSYIPYTQLTQVYQGPAVLTNTVDPETGGSWVNIPLEEPFIMDSNLNLVIAVLENQAGELGLSTSRFYVKTTPNVNRSLFSYNSATPGPYNVETISSAGNQRAAVPEIVMLFAPPIQGGYISVSSNPLDFGSVGQGNLTTQTLTITNRGAQPLTISNITLPQYMTTTQTTPFIIEPAENQVVEFTLTPATLGAYSGSIVINSNAINQPELTIGVVARVTSNNIVEILGSGNTYAEGIPFYPYYRYTYSQSIYLTSEINQPSGNMIEALQWHYLGAANYTQDISVYMGYTNLAAFPNSSYIPHNDLTLVYNGPVVLINQTNPAPWIDIILNTPFQYNSNQNLVIAVLDNQAGAQASMLSYFYTKSTSPANRSLTSYNDNNPYDVESISAATYQRNHVPELRLMFGPPVAGAYIAVAPNSLNYGIITAGEGNALPITITNMGSDLLTISNITLPPNMVANPPSPFTIPSGDNQIVTFTLTPDEEGMYNGDIVIHSNATNNDAVTIPVVASVLPDNLVFIGDGTVINQGTPFDPYYRYSYSQTIYTPDDLAEIDDGAEITHIGYNYNGYAPINQTARIYMGTTNQSSFTADEESYIDANILTLVYDGVITAEMIPNSWSIVTLTTPYIYDASQNLVIAFVEYQDGDFASSSCDFYATTTPTAQSITNCNDGTPYDELNYTPAGTIYARNSRPNTAFRVIPSGLPRPRNLQATAGYGRVTLSWQAPNIPPEVISSFLGYKIYRNGVDIVVGLALGMTEYIDTEGAPGVTYNYWVVAEYMVEGVVMESIPSNVVAIASLEIVFEAHPPTNLTVTTVRDETLRLNWQPGLIVLSEGFEGDLNPLWTNESQDSDAVSWQISPTGGAVDNGGYIYSSSLNEDGELISPLYNFLASPPFTVGADGALLNYWVGAFDELTQMETYWVMLANPAGSNYSTIHTITLDNFDWQKQSIDLSAYTGRNISVGFMHVGGVGISRNRLKLDGFEVVKLNDGQDLSTMPAFYKVYQNGIQVSGDGYDLTNFTTQLLTPNVYYFWVTSVYTTEGGGNIESGMSNVVKVTVQTSDADEVMVPAVSRLAGNYPNPFNPTTVINFELAQVSPVTIDIYNVKGQKVRGLVSGTFEAGTHSVVWNGCDDKGVAVSSGIYLYRMTCEGYSGVRKMVMMK